MAKNFLLRENRNPVGGSSFVFPVYAASRRGASAAITIYRGEPPSGKQLPSKDRRLSQLLTIAADSETVAAIWSLSWENFRRLQQDFAQWLIAQNKPKYLFDGLKKPSQGFNDFDEYPAAYWGSLDGQPYKNATVNYAWNRTDRDHVHYAARKLPS